MSAGVRGLTVLLGLALFACSGPTLDGSSQEAFESSRDAVRKSLNAEMQERFDSALAVVAMDGLEMSSLFAAAANPEQFLAGRLESLDGLTAAQVVSKADSITAEREREMREAALEEIAELETKMAAAESAKARLAEFNVARARLQVRERYGMEDLILTMDVANNLEVAVARAYFVGTYQSPGRSVPWVKETFNYTIPGGLEPGETARWSLAPNIYSGDWRNATGADGDAVFTVEVVRLDGADGEPIADADFSERDRERLAELRSSLGSH